jgi:hypothetical protein
MRKLLKIGALGHDFSFKLRSPSLSSMTEAQKHLSSLACETSLCCQSFREQHSTKFKEKENQMINSSRKMSVIVTYSSGSGSQRLQACGTCMSLR